MVIAAVQKMIPSAVRASCLCSREIWLIANSLTEAEIARAREVMLPHFRPAALQVAGPARGSLWSALRSLWSG